MNLFSNFILYCSVCVRYYGLGPDSDGKLNNAELRGQIPLQGAVLAVYKVTRFTIQAADEKKTSLVVRASSSAEVRFLGAIGNMGLS